MRLRIFTEPQQGASYDDLLAVAQATETLGFDAFFRSDHYLAMGDHVSGLPGPTDAWTTLAGLARETQRIRLGTLVSSVTYRPPGVLAIQVAQVDQMSGGRVELGLGTGWFEQEHLAYGIPFPAKRFGMLEEQLEVITGLWGTPVGETYSFAGEHYTLVDSPALPKPTQSRVPVIVGGGGAKRTPAMAARFATEFNLPFPDFADIPAKFAGVRAACEAIGRNPQELVYSTALIAVAGADEAEFARRAAAVGREPAELREHGIAGTTGEVVDRLGALAADGVECVYLQIMDLADLEHLDFLAREVMPQLD
ncbi:MULTISPECIES: LLM class F420-dependent oxidoreductase [Cryobacterium]|uniref:LLM class F420-dependent oxidoreductase n=1 Tax=Cryobacterium TaxID=69578 RepID=UPI000B4D4FF3|nr:MULTISPECIES: LLM class F420-dependent oxidoreductase [Cryobacterium]ASD20819.1 LLM class F420-dependent oxidoreductase [Cryobacterium sp. LW097]POH69561.1 TIGR03560 family F420-dependent LLM class oxidoreductase [Cryobacterium zongtaii]TFC44254.1 LLM class F420-dependent oxidoreductase [Cryobacterium sp. TMN-39-2]TFC52483.1 LLM class F420-dependent oxidoreductase [Cryobacterium sp. TMB3-1-2]TFC61303.1 LLM class F420-dependent oxidoreductase [Cryobacterium sp. TMB1-7]